MSRVWGEEEVYFCESRNYFNVRVRKHNWTPRFVGETRRKLDKIQESFRNRGSKHFRNFFALSNCGCQWYASLFCKVKKYICPKSLSEEGNIRIVFQLLNLLLRDVLIDSLGKLLFKYLYKFGIAYIRTYVHTYIHTHIHIYIYIYTHTCNTYM